MTWAHLLIGAWVVLAVLQISLWIDPGLNDARSQVPLLDAAARPLSGALGKCLWWSFYILTFVATIIYLRN